MAYQFDLNVQLEDDDDGNLPFDLNDPVMEDHGNVCFHFFCIIPCTFYHSLSFFYTGIDLNLPLDEFGAVDFDYVQNLPGNSFSTCYNLPSYYYAVFFYVMLCQCRTYSICYFFSPFAMAMRDTYHYEYICLDRTIC